MRRYQNILLLFSIVFCLSACGRVENVRSGSVSDDPVGGRCEGCEAIYESPIPHEKLDNTDTTSGFYEDVDKLMITGVVYEIDGKTPAKDVIVYYYHTDSEGYYSKKGGETGWGNRHGYLRGWLKTNEKGEYKFFTLKPAPYPNATEPAHIHMIVKEPEINEYYIDDIVFEEDPFVDEDYRNRVRDNAGSGIIPLSKQNGMFLGTRNVILGKNILNYP